MVGLSIDMILFGLCTLCVQYSLLVCYHYWWFQMVIIINPITIGLSLWLVCARAGRCWNFKTFMINWIENCYIRYTCQFEYLSWECHQNNIIFRPMVPFQTDIGVDTKISIFDFCKIPYPYFKTGTKYLVHWPALVCAYKSPKP